MADYIEQTDLLWDEWIAETGQVSGDPADFVEWGLANRKLALRPQDVRRLLRKQVTGLLRKARRFDPDGGYWYRSKQSVTLFDGELPTKHFFDTDKGGTPNLRQKAVKQRRDAIADHVYRAACDVDHMNRAFPDDPQLTFFPDFNDDVAEKRAADVAASKRKDGDEDAA